MIEDSPQIHAGMSEETLLSSHFKSILGSVYPNKAVDEEGKRFVKLLMETSVGETLAGKS